MSKTQWMVLLMVAAIGVVGCSKSTEETSKDPDATKEVADASKEVKATYVVDAANVADVADVADVAKPTLKTLTETVEDNEAVATAVEAVSSSDSRDKVFVDQLALMTSMTGVLEGVTDKATAEKAKPELKSLTEKAEVIKARADKLGEPSQEEEEAMKAKYGPQMEAVGSKMMAQMMRLMAKPEAMAVIQQSMSKGSAEDSSPKSETPKIETPKIEAPKIETPKVEIPKLKMPG
jgi:hypothetical protein